MYTPSQFSENNLERLHDFIEGHSFATVITTDEVEPIASHLPLLLNRSAGTHGQLIGHLAKANPQWRSAEGKTTLSIFHGPHAYISPTWYEVQNAVPTWNYVAVHVYGKWKLEENRGSKAEIIRRYVETYESAMPKPWSADQTEEGFVDQLLDGIVCFTIDIERIEGKWKLNQNHEPERRRRAIQALLKSGNAREIEVANLMRKALLDSDVADDKSKGVSHE